MARVRPIYEGTGPRVGEPWTELPFEDAIRVLDLAPQYFVPESSYLTGSGDMGHDLAWGGSQHIVVEVDDQEVWGEWRRGFYKSPLSPTEANFRLRVHQRLGDFWRDEWMKGYDADGDPAVWLWAVLKADAPDSEWATENRKRIQEEVREAAAESGLSDWVFVRFRKEAEERVAS